MLIYKRTLRFLWRGRFTPKYFDVLKFVRSTIRAFAMNPFSVPRGSSKCPSYPSTMAKTGTHACALCMNHLIITVNVTKQLSFILIKKSSNSGVLEQFRRSVLLLLLLIIIAIIDCCHFRV